MKRGVGLQGKGKLQGSKTGLQYRLLVFLIGANVAGVLLLLHLLGGDHRLLINFTLGHLASGLVLLVLVLALPLGALAGAGVSTGLVVVALPRTCAHGWAGIGDPCPDAGLLPFQ